VCGGPAAKRGDVERVQVALQRMVHDAPPGLTAAIFNEAMRLLARRDDFAGVRFVYEQVRKPLRETHAHSRSQAHYLCVSLSRSNSVCVAWVVRWCGSRWSPTRTATPCSLTRMSTACFSLTRGLGPTCHSRRLVGVPCRNDHGGGPRRPGIGETREVPLPPPAARP
jgi:hypothetical protein